MQCPKMNHEALAERFLAAKRHYRGEYGSVFVVLEEKSFEKNPSRGTSVPLVSPPYLDRSTSREETAEHRSQYEPLSIPVRGRQSCEQNI